MSILAFPASREFTFSEVVLIDVAFKLSVVTLLPMIFWDERLLSSLILEPVAETASTGALRLPVDGLVEFHHALLAGGILDKPAIQWVVEDRLVGTPAVRIVVHVRACVCVCVCVCVFVCVCVVGHGHLMQGKDT